MDLEKVLTRIAEKSNPEAKNIREAALEEIEVEVDSYGCTCSGFDTSVSVSISYKRDPENDYERTRANTWNRDYQQDWVVYGEDIDQLAEDIVAATIELKLEALGLQTLEVKDG